MEKVDRFEKMLKEQPYSSLSPEDKKWVMQFASTEEAYESMRRASTALEEHFATSPAPPAADPKILASLQSQLRLKHTASLQQSSWSVPAWAAIIAFVIAGGAGWYGGMSTGTRDVYVDRIVTKTDTLHVASAPDTIIVERVVYRQVPAAIPATTVSQKAPIPSSPTRGVNMKEKEELEKL